MRGIARLGWMAFLLACMLAAAVRAPVGPAPGTAPRQPETGALSATLDSPCRGEPNAITCLAVSPDGRWLAAGTRWGGGGRPSEVALWSLDGVPSRRLLTGHALQVTAVAFSPDSELLASASWIVGQHVLRVAGEIRLWRTRSGQFVRTLNYPEDCYGHVWALAFSPDGERLVSGGWLREERGSRFVGIYGLLHWDVRGGDLRRRMRTADVVHALAFSRDGRLLAIADEQDTSVLDLATGRQRWSRRAWARGLAFSPDGNSLLGAGNRVRVWAVTGGRLRRTVRGDAQQLGSVAVSPDGKEFSTGGLDLRRWDLRSGRLLEVVHTVGWPVNAVTYTPNGRTLVSGEEDGVLRLWNPPAKRGRPGLLVRELPELRSDAP